METSKNDTSSAKTGLESLSKEELINKYKGLLNIAKKAKQAKDEIAEENRLLKETLQRNETQKEADKKALLTMKETLEQFTEQKLLLSTQLDELRQLNRQENDLLSQLRIENESLRRQMDSLTTDNESLLNDIDAMENQLKQVNIIGNEQKKHLELLEFEVNRLKERESHTSSLEQRLHVSLAENKALKEQENLTKKSLNEITEKYQHIKEINTQQRHKFNTLKERFVDVLRKLKKLKECKRILLETQQEYAEAVSKWQNEIIYGARQLCKQLQSLKSENDELIKQLNAMNAASVINEDQKIYSNVGGDFKLNFNIESIVVHLNDLENLANVALVEEQLRREEQIKSYEKTENEQNSCCENLRLENSRLKDKLKHLTTQQEHFAAMRKEKDDLTAENMKLNNELLEKLQISESIKQKHDQLEANFQAIETFNKKLQNECENLKELIKQHELKMEDDNEILAQNSKLVNDLKNLNKKFEEKTQQYEKLENELATLKLSKQTYHNVETEQQPTLSVQTSQVAETRLANQAADYEKLLMEKSEIESKNQYLLEKLAMQTEKCEEYEKGQQSSEKILESSNQTIQELQKYRQLYEELQSRHERKEREHTDLLDEMRELNEALKKRGDLISRQEERQNELNSELKRLQQIEQALKDKEQLIQQKDNELKEINEAVKTSQAKVEELTAACTRSEEQFHAMTLELQSLKNNETNDAQSDAVSITSTMSRAEELSRMREVDESLEERYTKLKTLAIKLKKKLQEQTANTNELNEQLKAQETALVSQNKLNETLMTENKKLKNTRSKQSNMLNLEIEAAEKSLSEVSTKLQAKTSELNDLRAVLETKESTIVQLRKELAIVEAAKASECEHAKELKTQIDLLQTQIKDAVHSKQMTLDANKDLEHKQEHLKLEIEDLRLQLSQSESKQLLKLTSLTEENKQLQTKLLEMETVLTSTQQKLNNTERSLDEVRIEYMEYKVKAQSVLRKQQTKDTTQERELEEELLSMRQQTMQMETLTQTLRQKLETSEKKLEILTEDNTCLLKRKEELIKLAEELRLQNEALLQEQRTLLQAQQDTLRQQRQQIENLDEYHKTQMERLESNYQKQLAELKAELNKTLTTNTMRPAPLIGAVAKSTSIPLTSNFGSHDNAADLMEREDAEGSESANVITLQSLAAKRKISNTSSSTARRRSLHELMPLDELLNAPMNALNSETILTATNNNILAGSFSDDSGNSINNMTTDSVEHMELQAAKERLQIQESRVRHLTALLAENEQDLAKLTQMNDMLKEELRRQERSVEREQHMHNSEYLKNVIIKFITLNSVDERTRLVPVLNTILKLSRAEVEMLNCVAKGQKVAEHTRSWSNFLPSWGGSGGGSMAGNNGN